MTSPGASRPAVRPAWSSMLPKVTAYKTELRNFRLIGDNIAIDGWVGLGPDHHPMEYHFPHFSINVVTNMDVQGTMRPGRVWDVKARGKTYDAKELFHSLISFGQVSDRQRRPEIARVSIWWQRSTTSWAPPIRPSAASSSRCRSAPSS